jgi:hypothetical protein
MAVSGKSSGPLSGEALPSGAGGMKNKSFDVMAEMLLTVKKMSRLHSPISKYPFAEGQQR